MSPTSALLPEDPSRLGEFWLSGRLGAGGQGVVYEAYDGEGTRVAVKVLHGDAAADPDLRARFGREATAARRVASFCTAQVLAVDLEAPKPYIVSEYVAGPSLRQAVADGRRFRGDELHRLATAVATALAAIHDAGVIHRDLKPDNVLLGPDGPRVIDFGVARTLEMSLTASGLVTGTPTYMAPEVFMGQRAAAPADVFSWGAVVLYAASGDDPFHAESLGAVMHRVLATDPDLDVLPASLRPLVEAALSKEPEERPTARQLLLGLISQPGDAQADLLRAGSAEAGLLGADGPADPGLGTLAEEAYGFLDPSERNLVPDVFLRMVGVGESGDLALRALPREELFGGRTSGETAALRRVLTVFSYLVTARGEEFALARPALLRAWPRLRAWVDDERDGLAVHSMIRQAARQWEGHGRRDGDVLQGGRLETARRWASTGRRHLRLSPLEGDFLDACEAATRRRGRRRLLLTITLAALLVVSLVAVATVVRQSGVVAGQRDQALAGQAASESDRTRTSDPVRAMLLGVASWRLSGTAQTRAALQNSWAQRERAVFTDPWTGGESVRRITADGRRLVSVSPQGVRIYDLRSGKRTGGWDGLGIGDDRFRGADISPSGRHLAVAAGDTVSVWDMTTGKPTGARHRLDEPEIFNFVTFAEGDRYVEVHAGQGGTIWDTRMNATFAPRGALTHASFNPENTLAAVMTMEHGFELLRLPGGTPVARWHGANTCEGAPQGIAFSPDGRTIACVSRDVISLVDVRTRRTLWNGDGDGGIWFSPDGRYLAVGGDRMRLLRAEDGVTVLTFQASPDGVAFDGTALRYLADDTVVTLDISDIRAPARLPGARPDVAQLSPDGRLLATHRSGARNLVLMDAARRRPLGAGIPLAEPDGVERDYLAFSGDGRVLAFVDGRRANVVRVWDTARHVETGSVTLPGDWYAYGLAMNDDGSVLVVSATTPDAGPARGHPQRLFAWDVRRRLWIKTFDPGAEMKVVFRPASDSVIPVGSPSGRLIDVPTGQASGPAFGSGRVDRYAVARAFSPDGRILATADESGRLAFWDVATGRRRGPVFRVATSGTAISALLFSPRGDVAASVLSDGTVQLWDVATPAPLGSAIPGGSARLLTAAFASGGQWLRLLDATGVVRDLAIDPETQAATICTRATRPLTEPEWRRSFPDVPYRDICDG
ncbi:serine/threonine-protein kinase [Sphaerisporangium sp. NPDC051017]|uniref:WD40 repeat domain-containing serine/threonine protein kinase n=1 Tax=Sphaerisporangium sp. NPDC051017 TaxID=3154636 RepID=UPI00342AD40C